MEESMKKTYVEFPIEFNLNIQKRQECRVPFPSADPKLEPLISPNPLSTPKKGKKNKITKKKSKKGKKGIQHRLYKLYIYIHAEENRMD